MATNQTPVLQGIGHPKCAWLGTGGVISGLLINNLFCVRFHSSGEGINQGLNVQRACTPSQMFSSFDSRPCQVEHIDQESQGAVNQTPSLHSRSVLRKGQI